MDKNGSFPNNNNGSFFLVGKPSMAMGFIDEHPFAALFYDHPGVILTVTILVLLGLCIYANYIFSDGRTDIAHPTQKFRLLTFSSFKAGSTTFNYEPYGPLSMPAECLGEEILPRQQIDRSFYLVTCEGRKIFHIIDGSPTYVKDITIIEAIEELTVYINYGLHPSVKFIALGLSLGVVLVGFMFLRSSRLAFSAADIYVHSTKPLSDIGGLYLLYGAILLIGGGIPVVMYLLS